MDWTDGTGRQLLAIFFLSIVLNEDLYAIEQARSPSAEWRREEGFGHYISVDPNSTAAQSCVLVYGIIV